MGTHTNGLIFNILAYGLTILVSLLAVGYVVIQVLSLFGVQVLRL
jgi:hypothetical protein